ncbi:DEKNAAC104288 [Brettanomyces naardenensis]|uniref:DEKNAAC104288 n=1 Tax=Brettanomyces naardenensis TaxID=13370 RepID=A0A448YPS2_BRENA|nr:DEKNAAC104288 [Brettanomyces naardenensis]
MDQLLSKAGSTLVTFAIRSSVQLASTYLIKSVSQLVENVPNSDKKRVSRLQHRLQNRIEIVTHAIELIKLLASRGNTNLESTLRLGDELKQEIDEFHDDIETVSEDQRKSSGKLTLESIKIIEKSMNQLLSKIDQAIPIINLALTTSGANLSGNLNNYVSPGQLLRSTAILSSSNEKSKNIKSPIQVGPSFDLTMYDVFYNANGGGSITWKEKYARCKFQILRIPDDKFEYSYNLEVEESFDDGRYHDEEEEKPGKLVLDLRAISRLFFSASGKLLKLEDRSSPVLVLKVRSQSRKEIDEEMLGESDVEGEFSNAKWVAFGDYEGDEDDNDSDEDSESDEDNYEDNGQSNDHVSSLSLIEYVIRLCALQANDQMSIFEVKDERLRLYLNDENNMVHSQNAAAVPKLSSQLAKMTLTNDGEASALEQDQKRTVKSKRVH